MDGSVPGYVTDPLIQSVGYWGFMNGVLYTKLHEVLYKLLDCKFIIVWLVKFTLRLIVGPIVFYPNVGSGLVKSIY